MLKRTVSLRRFFWYSQHMFWLRNKTIIFSYTLLSGGLPSACQTVWILTRSDVMSGLIWIQTVCIGYKQTKLAGKELNTFLYLHNMLHFFFNFAIDMTCLISIFQTLTKFVISPFLVSSIISNFSKTSFNKHFGSF